MRVGIPETTSAALGLGRRPPYSLLVGRLVLPVALTLHALAFGVADVGGALIWMSTP